MRAIRTIFLSGGLAAAVLLAACSSPVNDEAAYPLSLDKFHPSDRNDLDHFGDSVALDGEYAIVGAYEDDDKGTDSGSAFVYRRSGSGWTQAAKLTASDGEAEDYFGCSVAVSGDCAIVGAYQEDERGTGSGAAYVFQRSDSGWAQVAKLTASDGAAGDRFGYSVDLGASNGKLSVYSIGSDGALSESAVYDTGRWPTTVTISPDGRNLYVALLADFKVASFAIGSDGALTLVGTYATGHSPQRAAVTPDGSYVYVANNSPDTLSLFSVGSGGVLTPLDGSPLAAGNGPWGIAATR